MMWYTYQNPRWWQIGVPLLLVGGLLVLESHAPLSPGGHQVAQFLLMLLMYGIFLGWVWGSRGARLHAEPKRAQDTEWIRQARQQRRALSLSTHARWENTCRPWQRSHKQHTDN